jgi:subtilisin family serine protease
MGTPIDDDYTSASGTSMATPHASGLAALLLQAKSSLSPSEIKQTLMNTALDLGQDVNAQGTGRARAEHALQAALGQAPPEPLPTFLVPFIGQ